MFEILVAINLVGLTFIYNINRKIKKMNNEYYVVDIRDNFILYTGTLEDCNEVLEQNYAGLQVVLYEDLTKAMKLQLQKGI
jgi:hypothetical protein